MLNNNKRADEGNCLHCWISAQNYSWSCIVALRINSHTQDIQRNGTSVRFPSRRTIERSQRSYLFHANTFVFTITRSTQDHFWHYFYNKKRIKWKGSPARPIADAILLDTLVLTSRFLYIQRLYYTLVSKY